MNHTTRACVDSVKASVSAANVKEHSAGRSQIGAGTREIRRMLIGRELFRESL
jgi:hypothetical protein